MISEKTHRILRKSLRDMIDGTDTLTNKENETIDNFRSYANTVHKRK